MCHILEKKNQITKGLDNFKSLLVNASVFWHTKIVNGRKRFSFIHIILWGISCEFKIISAFNHGSLRTKRHIQTIGQL